MAGGVGKEEEKIEGVVGGVSLSAVWKDLLHGWPQHSQEQVLQGGGKDGGGDGGESGLRP